MQKREPLPDSPEYLGIDEFIEKGTHILKRYGGGICVLALRHKGP